MMHASTPVMMYVAVVIVLMLLIADVAEALLSGNLELSFAYHNSSALDITMQSPTSSGKYFAVSAASSAMDGKGVACKQPNSGETTATCSVITTFSYGVSSRTDSTLTVVSASADATTAQVTVRVDPTAMGVSLGSQRFIFAIGTWGSGLPLQHASAADRSPATLTVSAAGATTTAAGAPATTSAAPKSLAGQSLGGSFVWLALLTFMASFTTWI